MDSRNLSAKQLADILVAVLTRCRHRAGEDEWDAIQEALRRVGEHERLLRDILPELRNQLSAAQDGQSADPNLARVVQAWPALPPHLRAAVLALVWTAGGNAPPVE
jgi:hypothetical protein